MRRITKVKLTSDNKIHITFEQKCNGKWDEYAITCSEKARPAFYAAMDLSAYVIRMCELPEDYQDKIRVRGVSVSYGGEKEVMGATITAQMALRYSNCPLNLNTPHKASEPYSEGPCDEKQLLDPDCAEALNSLYEECFAYIDGDRAQGKLELPMTGTEAQVPQGPGEATYGDTTVKVTGPMFGVPAQKLADELARGVGKVRSIR